MSLVNHPSSEQKRQCFVFLDLEETVIDDWSTRNFLVRNIDKIEAFLNGRDVVIKNGNKPIVSPATPLLNMRLGLMSWAVWDSRDKAIFVNEIQPELEKMLGCKFDPSYIWSMDDWAKAILGNFNKKIDRDDMYDLYGKPEVLIALARTNPEFKNSTIFLIDDAYEHLMTFMSHKRECVLEFRNINEM